MRDTTRCRRPQCRKPWHKHERGLCPGLDGSAFLRHMPRIAAGQSFTTEEIDCLDFITRGLLQGADISRATRLPGFASLCRKSKTMRTQIDVRKSLKAGRG